MKTPFLRHGLGLTVAFLATIGSVSGSPAEPRHAIAMYGDPALPPDFVSLPYVNADAPQGGTARFGEPGSFDSLNPFILKGSAPYGVQVYVFQSMMGRSWDEPFTLYCVICESVDTGPNREWVEYTLRPEAKFSDGSPITVEDVIWSYETLGTIGHPRYQNSWSKVEKIEQNGPDSLRITFNTEDRELALIMGLRPILKKSVYDGKDFTESGFDPVPIGSGPYTIGEYQAGRFIRLMKDPDWWANDLPFFKGQHNLGEIRYDYFGDGDVIFEAFKAGELSTYREGNVAKWDSQYDFPRVQSGEIVKSEIPHQRPSGLIGYVMNTRNPAFQDWHVREAMISAFPYGYISDTLNAAGDPRVESYFSNSKLAMDHGPATGKVKDLLQPFADTLPPGALDGYTLPEDDGTERNRAGVARALDLMAEAGWTIQNGVMKNAGGEPFTFEILLSSGATETQQTIDIYVQALKRIGITPTVTSVDSAQYTQRTNNYDFDMAYYLRPASLSPGNELNLYFGAEGVEQPGTRNWMGMDSPAMEAMIRAILTSETTEDFTAAAKAMDRVLMAGRYVIPIWYAPVSRLAHDKHLHYAKDKVPMWGDYIGFLPDIWWYE